MNNDTEGGGLEQLVPITLRLARSDLDELRFVSKKARRRPAEMARLLVQDALRGALPGRLKPAPPAPSELAVEAQQLLAACTASVANLTQIKGHAQKLGYPQASALAIEFDRMSDLLRGVGLSLKMGLQVPECAPVIESAAGQVNDLARALNTDARSVPPRSWTPPLTALRAALAGLEK